MSFGRNSTFFDIYIERDLKNGTLDEAGAQELIDNIVMKLRIVRFLRTKDYDAIFSGDPYWATWSDAGFGDDGRTMVTKTSFRLLNTLTLEHLGPGPEPNITIFWDPKLPEATSASAPRSPSTPRPSSMSPTRRSAATGATTRPSPAACPRCASASRCSSSPPA